MQDFIGQFIFIAELRKKYGQDWEDLGELYLEGRCKSTIMQYNGAYKKWKRFLEDQGRRYWTTEEVLVCKYLKELEARGLGEGVVNQYFAMMTLMEELKGASAVSKNPVISQVRKAIIKRMNMKKNRRVRLTMTRKHMRILVKRLYYKKDVSLTERRILTMVGCMFYCLKRFSDVSRWKVENIRELPDGSFEIVQVSSKTDQEGRGVLIRIPSGKKGKVGPAELLRTYLRSMGNSESGFVFCAMRASKKGLVPMWSKAVGYDTVRRQMKEMCRDNGLPELDVHSARIGGATESARMGASRQQIKIVGNWRSAAVDGYIRPDEPMRGILDLLL